MKPSNPFPPRLFLNVLLPFLVGLFVVEPVLAKTQRDSLFITGAEVASGNDYVFAGWVLPIGKNRFGEGLVQRYWLDRSSYQYDSGAQQIDATAYAAEASVGKQWLFKDGWGGAYLGLRYIDTRLSPDDLENASRGEHLRGKVQFELENAVGRDFRFNGIASYVAGAQSYWFRGRLLWGKSPQAWGVEAMAHGDPEYRARQFGVVYTGLEPSPGLTMGLKAGVRHSDGETNPYAGMELTYPF